MTARVLTVKSTRDWKVRIGGSSTRRFARASRAICCLQHARQQRRLPRAVDRERVVLERVELRHHAQPRRLRKPRKDRRPAEHPGEPCEGGDPDHRRDQDDAIGPGQLRIVEGVERVLHRERAAVGEPDQMQGARGTDAPPGLSHRETRRFRPVLPVDVGQGGRHGAMRRQPDRDGDIAVLPVPPREVAQAVRRIGQSVQQHDRADGGSFRLEDVRAIPVVREAARIDRAAVVVAVGGGPVFRLELLCDLRSHLVEERLLGLDVAFPLDLPEIPRLEIVGDVGVPQRERRPSLRVPHADREQQQDAHGDQYPARHQQLDRL